MILKRFYDEGLAQASYLVGCAVTGEAIVIDPNRDIAQYRAAADADKLRITHVTETHIHADFVSGTRELASATGAREYLSAEGGSDWQYAFAAEDGAQLLRDGDVIMVGNIRLEVMHTPGHTPEHISFLVTDTAGASEPMGILSGDFVFVGDVGRPDLLERAAMVANTMEAGARQLFRSLERFRALPDWIQVWPGHGAGSACGKSLGAVPTSTVGYEKRYNWAVGTVDQALFVEMVLAGQPDPPKYFAEMKRINRDGPRVLGGFPKPPREGRESLARALELGARAVVVDTRTAVEFGKAHVPGTLNIPLNKSFSTWAGWLVPYDADVHLIADDMTAVDRAVRELAMIGLDRVTTWYDSTVIEDWRKSGAHLGTIKKTDVGELATRDGNVTILDVRNTPEWSAGHVPGAIHIPVGQLAERLAELPRDKPLIVHCQGGGRSAIATSLLQTLGLTNAEDLKGGYNAWTAAGNEGIPGNE